ncbi:hypothetical protein [Legionella cherrii]|uniref:Uncharacterized protein n=1 Tax=Legionella cherrii TaxID=28084 RepID=A0A0W0S798_9GAMM|nr:hypothetical protein [Legionella cherrii]KTC78961.1 hypothetical protein Lche_0981 [Legionella cherrii]VEB36264.1 Uncharacterised protein [Legionella cherrii]
MPKKNPFKIAKEFVEQVIAILANETVEGREKIVAIAQRAEKEYERPVKSWLTGWVYQFTRTRGDKVGQSINVMENFPDAYTRLLEFKLMISEGEWNVDSSYNYFLFRQIADAVYLANSDFQRVEEHLIPTFLMALKNEVMVEINSYLAQRKLSLEDKKNRELECQAAHESARQLAENVMVFNDLETAKNYQSKQQNKIIFSLSFKNQQWHLSWVDVTGQVYPLTQGQELAQKLSTLEEKDIEKLNSVHLKQIKRECIKAREEYVAKVQVHVDPELSNEDLIRNGITSAFVLRHQETGPSLWWINSMGIPNPIGFTDHHAMSSWLSKHQGSFTEADVLQLKAYLLQLNTKQSIATSKLDKMNVLLSKVLQNKDKQEQLSVDGLDKEADKGRASQNKINLKKFAFLEENMKDRIKKIVSQDPSTKEKVVSELKQECVEEITPEKKSNKLGQDRYSALSGLPTFWQQRKSAMEESLANEVINEKQPVSHP